MGFHAFKTLPLALLLLPAAVVAAPPLLAQAGEDQDDYAGEAADRYAQVRMLEGEATIRKGEVEEPLGTGVPVAEGDVVESRGRGVLQLGDGSRIAFGAGTRFTVATLFMDRQGERQVLLKLDSGRLRMAVGSGADTRVRVDSPLGSVTFGEKANVALDLERHGLEIKVFSTRATVQNQQDRVTLRAGEELRFDSSRDGLDRVRDFNTYDLDEFENWSGPRVALRRARDLERVPEEIRPYAEDLAGNGDWVYVDETQSYCWRPRGVPQEWRPYWRGRWASYPSGMTWVSDEPWGFVTHHYGRWGWSLSLGWYWIPGIQFSPAWVAWQSSDAYFGWAPLGYHDRPCTWGYGEWGGGYCWNVVEINFISASYAHRPMYRGWRNIPDFRPHREGPLAPPWRRSPLMARPSELRDPNQFRRLIQQRDVRQERMRDYARQSERDTGRRVYRFEGQDRSAPKPGAPSGSPVPGFQERERQWRKLERPDARPGSGGVMPPHRTEPGPAPQNPGGGLPSRREQPRSPELNRPSKDDTAQPRQNSGGVVPPQRVQPRTPEVDRAVPRPDTRQNSGGVVGPRRDASPQEEGDRGRREQDQTRRETPDATRSGRGENPREAAQPKASRSEERPGKAKEKKADHKDERSRDSR